MIDLSRYGVGTTQVDYSSMAVERGSSISHATHFLRARWFIFEGIKLPQWSYILRRWENYRLRCIMRLAERFIFMTSTKKKAGAPADLLWFRPQVRLKIIRNQDFSITMITLRIFQENCAKGLRLLPLLIGNLFRPTLPNAILRVLILRILSL